jgi:hypothetical protein
MEVLALHPRGDEARRRVVLKQHGHAGAWLVHNAKPVEDHRVDGAPSSDQAGLGSVVHGTIKDLTNAQLVKHPGHEPKMIQDFTPGRSVHRRLRSAGDAPHIPS